ncbi:triacylglycerol lipase OBL1-like [Telopea speciosissima]|uniref:triacylglycerol lipase OBL1-like n=1 Tax=Telopea speciosissima TaxID=54955 RepID=UPI001CC54216|nr:triacylglycerol lipase OBL1-like [Telopea speciosissima]
MACNCNEGFCDNYLVMNPKEASFMDLFHLLFSSDLEKRKFVKHHRKGAKKVDHRRRWIIFVSVFIQKILLLSAKPMSWFGSVLEQWLNLLLCNGGFIKLIFNLITGNVVMPPEKSSATFTSYIGSLDTRLDLDKSIKNGDSRYYGELSMMASKIVYENKAFIQNVVTNHWKMKFLGFYDFWNDYEQKLTTQAFMFQDKEINPEIIMVAFRGTEPFNADDWITDFDISWYELPGVGKIHGGFMKALGLQKSQGWPKEVRKGNNNPSVAYYAIREMLKDMLKKNEKAKFIVTGHSLGGALAILFPLVLSLHDEAWLLERMEGVYTFGQPRVGDQKLGEYMNKQFKVHSIKYLRLVYCNDMVPRLPYDDCTLLFKHFGTCFYYNSFYEGKIVGEEPNKNYLSILEAIPIYLNAMWELIRGFIIPYAKGRDYAEGGILRMFRLIGLLLPGLSAHGPQDYVNSTRLCSSIPSLQIQDLTHQKGLKYEKKI